MPLSRTPTGTTLRFKSVFKEVLEMDLESDPDWQFICDCEKIRDCLLHANGRIDLLTEKRKLDIEGVLTRLKDLLRVRTNHVEITGEFLLKFQGVANNFLTKVEVTANPPDGV